MAQKSVYGEKVQPYLDQIADWVEQSIPEFKIYGWLGVSASMWLNYKQKHPDLQEALKRGNDAQIYRAEEKLMQLVDGFEEVDEKWERVYSEERGKFIEVRTEVRKKRKAPSTEAIKFFLTNKAGTQWKNRQDTTFKADTLEQSLMGMSDEALAELDAKLDTGGDDYEE